MGIGIGAGFLTEFPGLPPENSEQEENVLKQVEPDKLSKTVAVDHQLTVLNTMVDGEPDAEKLRKILAELEKEQKYGTRVKYAEINVSEHPEMAAEHGVDLENFAGQLDFYAAGHRLDPLRGTTDREKVDDTIQRYLNGLVKRFGAGWLPEVEGMRRAKQKEDVIPIEPADPVPPTRTQAPPGAAPRAATAREP
jgi:hypothetical protein